MPGLAQYLLENPLYGYGQTVAKQGADTSPVLSPWQGLARALQGGVGGYFEGQGLKQAKADQVGDNATLANAMSMYATDPKGAMAMIASKPNLSEFAQGLFGQQAAMQQKLAYESALGNMGADRIGLSFGRPPAAGANPGVVPQQQGAAPAPAAAPPAGDIPIATAHDPNNAGNIRPRGSADAFNRYASPQEGVAAIIQNAKAYPAAFNQGQPMTLAQIGARWAPKGDGANDPAAWSAGVAKASGLDPNQPLNLNDPNQALAFAKGVHAQEKGPQAQFAPEVYQQGAQLSGQGPVNPSGVYRVQAPGGGGGPQASSHPQGWNEQLWQQLEPLVRSRSITPEKAAEMLQADALSRRSLDQTQAHTMETERFKAAQQRTGHVVALKGQLEGDSNYKAVQTARPIMSSIYEYANDPTPASSVALVHSVAQILEPGSVSESGRVEFKEAGGVRERIKEYLGEARNGTLGPEKRAELVAIAAQRYKQMHEQADARGLDYRGIAEGIGLNPDHIYKPGSLAMPLPPRSNVTVQGNQPPPAAVAPPIQQGAPMVQAPPAQGRVVPSGPVKIAPPAVQFQRDQNGRLVPVMP